MTAPVRGVADLSLMLDRGERGGVPVLQGHQPEPDGRIGAGCLSQRWPASFMVDDRVFATAEHCMMWRKATLFGDRAAGRKILEAPHPHAAKALGGRVIGFDQQVWDEYRVPIVVAGNLAKFRRHRLLGDFPADTGRRILVEVSPVDRIWGIGLIRERVVCELSAVRHRSML